MTGEERRRPPNNLRVRRGAAPPAAETIDHESAYVASGVQREAVARTDEMAVQLDQRSAGKTGLGHRIEHRCLSNRRERRQNGDRMWPSWRNVEYHAVAARVRVR